MLVRKWGITNVYLNGKKDTETPFQIYKGIKPHLYKSSVI
jgi:hypothetical protein